MRIQFVLYVFLFFFIISAFSPLLVAETPIFQYISEIGDDRENYIIGRVGGIALRDSREIYIADRQLLNIRKYSWKGDYISKTGRKGSGPGDFISLGGLQWFDNKLIIFDFLGRRIAITDENMKNFSYIKANYFEALGRSVLPLRNAPIALNDNLFLGINSTYNKDVGRLFFFNKDSEVLNHFFCQLPTEILEDPSHRFYSPLTHPNAGVNHHKKQILVTFDYPDRDILFYIYDFSGHLLRQFKYRQEKGFRFPVEMFESFRNNPPRMTMIWDIFAYKSYYMVFLVNMFDFDKDSRSSKFYFLFFRDNGEFIYRLQWNVRFLTISPEGYLGGITGGSDDETKVVIYKFNPDTLEALARKSH